MGKRLFALLLAMTLFITYIPAMVFAEGGDDGAVYVSGYIPEESGTYVSEEETADSDELFIQFLQKGVSERTQGSKAGVKLRAVRTTRGSRLKGYNRVTYDLMAERIAAIANGEIDYTDIKIPFTEIAGGETVTITAGELGLDRILENGNETEAAAKALDEYISISYPDIIDALLVDKPYELYWFDKTWDPTYHSSPKISFEAHENFYEVTGSGYFHAGLCVCKDYSKTGADGTQYTDLAKTRGAAAFVANTSQIISDNAGKKDYNKLLAYKDKICALTDYNHNASGSSGAYGDPWQMIKVFDNDPSTKVVCEGYAKAFQFLCDNTQFSNSSIECHIVSGIVSAGVSAGEHMWNIVHMNDGKNYIADVTYSDAGSFAAPDYVFMTGYSSGDVYNGYVFKCAEGKTIKYQYDRNEYDDMYRLYDIAELTLSGNNYHTHTTASIARVEPTCTAAGLTEGLKCTDCGKIVKKQEAIAALGHSWGNPVYTWSSEKGTAVSVKTCTRCRKQSVAALTQKEAASEAVRTAADKAVSSAQSAYNKAVSASGAGSAAADMALSKLTDAHKLKAFSAAAYASTAKSAAAAAKSKASAAQSGTAAAVTAAKDAQNAAQAALTAANASKAAADAVLKDVLLAGLKAGDTEYDNAKAAAAAAAKIASDATAVKKAADAKVTAAIKAKTAADEAARAAAAEKKRQGVYSNSLPKLTSKKPSRARKALTAKWTKLSKKKQKKVGGIEIWVCPNKSFKANDTIQKTVKKSRKSLKVKGLHKKTTYYVKARTYIYKNGTKYVSAWSKVKTVKTK